MRLRDSDEDGPYADISIRSTTEGTHHEISFRPDDFLSVAAFLHEAAVEVAVRKRIGTTDK